MDNVLDNLIEIDKKARKSIEEAQSYYDNMSALITEECNKITQNYINKAKAHLDDVKRNEEAARDEAVEKIRKLYAGLTQELDAIYEKNHLEWEQQLFARVIAE